MLPEQRQRGIECLVRLSKNGSSRLEQDLRARKHGRLRRHVDVEMTLFSTAELVRMIVEFAAKITSRWLAAPNSVRPSETVAKAESTDEIALVAFADVAPPTGTSLRFKFEMETPPLGGR